MVAKRHKSLKPVLKKPRKRTPYKPMSDAAFRSWLRSQLRRVSLKWRPISEKRAEGEWAATDADKAKWGKLVKKMNTCELCGGSFPKSKLEVDHIIPCGSLLDVARDLGPFALRLFCQMDGLRRACRVCHQRVTNS